MPNTDIIARIEAAIARNHIYTAGRIVIDELMEDHILTESFKAKWTEVEAMHDRIGRLTPEVRAARGPMCEMLNAVLVKAGYRRYI
jgi:hypothetical protein